MISEDEYNSIIEELMLLVKKDSKEIEDVEDLIMGKRSANSLVLMRNKLEFLRGRKSALDNSLVLMRDRLK